MRAIGIIEGDRTRARQTGGALSATGPSRRQLARRAAITPHPADFTTEADPYPRGVAGCVGRPLNRSSEGRRWRR
jgi:hypothetical protein